MPSCLEFNANIWTTTGNGPKNDIEKEQHQKGCDKKGEIREMKSAKAITTNK